MTKGVLIFAQGQDISYIDLAKISAKRVKTFLNLPVSIVVDQVYEDSDEIFDKIIIKESANVQTRVLHDGETSKKIKWLNFDRSSCFDLTPYDETIVIDSDYIINSSHLLNCFDLDSELLLYKNHHHLLNNRYNLEFTFINEFGVPFYWATVFYFKKTAFTKSFFTLIQYIRDNWLYYSLLYQIKDPKFRNDFAFSIAVNLMTLHMKSKQFGFIPGKLHYVIDKDELIGVKDNSLNFRMVSPDQTNVYSRTSVLDVHIMNKDSILRVLQ